MPAQGSTARTRSAGSALRWCAGRRMTRATRTRTRTLRDETRGREASSTASGAAGATTMTATGGRRPRRCVPLVQTAGGRSALRAQWQSLRLRRRRLQRWRPLQWRHRQRRQRKNGSQTSTISRTAFTPWRNSGGIWCASKPPSNVAAPNARRGSETKDASWKPDIDPSQTSYCWTSDATSPHLTCAKHKNNS